jgi:hypothetical protein
VPPTITAAVDRPASPRPLGSARGGRGARRLVVVAAVVAALAAAGAVAYAFQTTNGSAATTASTSGVQPVSVASLVAGDATTSSLQPGGTADVVVRVQNPNAFAVRLENVTANGSVTSSGGTGTCGASGVSLVAQSGLGITIAAGTSTLVDLPGAATMATTSPTGCQGATFSIPVSLTAQTP